MKLVSYWLDTAEPAGDFRRSELPSRADVVVVGAGLTGLSTAVHLARRGADVALVDAHTVGWGASGRNGGMATTGLAISFATAVRRYGEGPATAMFRAYNDAIDTVEELVAHEGIDCDFERSGKLTLACKPAHYREFAASAELMGSLAGQEVRLVPPSRIREEIGSSYYHGAMVDPLGAGVHVGRLTAGLAGAAAARGVSLHEEARVRELVRRGPHAHDVRTDRGTIRADQVVVATSGYTGGLTPWLRRRIVPVGSFIIVTEPLPRGVADELLPRRRVASDSKHLLYYFRITPDNRLLFGGRARFSGSHHDRGMRSGRILTRAMTDVFPVLTGTRVDYCWGGLVDMTLDRMVHAGERDGVFYSVGYSGHGVQMATHMGKVLARVLAGEQAANPWRDLAFRAVPGHVGPPWFLPPAGAFYKFLDAVS
ncbi:NAD(P)/FAD-dependent oxidoreductase [Streptomyces radicis]|uniref:FAD-binding oxidoreductase n=1 Tax=Streptomyces radicis TaxID=1750517 RepID=A0A3A9WIP1_9ACTN|nr:FAD-binding oxidoreductase [Streptomyces radicis]RKN12845.1 FAD-binding oxidoreductase [Streptomyces radicis]RKN27390.1 FAD-binding oxidoreductase [Streptomyces radicis]